MNWSVTRVSILNVLNGMAGAKIKVDGIECGTLPASIAGAVETTVECAQALSGQQIVIESGKTSPLSFCGFTVFGTESEVAADRNLGIATSIAIDHHGTPYLINAH